MKARELMTSNKLECVTQQDSLQRAAQIMRDSNIGSVPVVEDEKSMRLVGIITDRDIAIRHVAENPKADCTVGDHMSKGRLHTASPDDEAEDVMRTMKAEQVRRVPVCEGDRLVGIIAQADVATETGDRKTGDVVEKISESNR